MSGNFSFANWLSNACVSDCTLLGVPFCLPPRRPLPSFAFLPMIVSFTKVVCFSDLFAPDANHTMRCKNLIYNR